MAARCGHFGGGRGDPASHGGQTTEAAGQNGSRDPSGPFAAMSVRLTWEGRPKKVERLRLPFQTVETINESRATRERDTGALFGLRDAFGPVTGTC